MCMSKNSKLKEARKNKNDEFYTQYKDIEKEINAYLEYNPNVFENKIILCPCDDPEWSNFTRYFVANFKKLKLKKLISTSYVESTINQQLSLFESESNNFDPILHETKGKVFILEADGNKDKKISQDDLKFEYLEGDGDFRSPEVTKLRDEADYIITNPPFSLFKEFFHWIIEANKKFLIIGNINCITYKEVFNNIQNNKVWLGTGMGRWISGFIVPDNYKLYGSETKIENNNRIVSTNNCLWLTNIDHNKRHEKIDLMTMEDNLKYNNKLIKKMKKDYKKIEYLKYDNYDAIEVPFYDSIPRDYKGIMGVPITFLDKYNPEQFDIIDINPHFFNMDPSTKIKQLSLKNHNVKDPYARILIKFKEND